MGERRLGDPLTIEQLRAALDYNPDTGIFTWKHRPDMSAQWNGKWAGKKAGGLHAEGYIGIRVNGRRHSASWLAWLWVHGDWPLEFIDHKNGDRSDNRIDNLREATKSENGANQGLHPNSTVRSQGRFAKRQQMARKGQAPRQVYLPWFVYNQDRCVPCVL